MTLLEWALRYVDFGWKVFACRPRAKEPLTEHGLLDATSDPALVTVWWKKWPDANIGMALPPDLIVLDIDGPEGEESLANLTAQYGELPPTLEQKTGCGRQLFFSVDIEIRNSAGKLGLGLDVRGLGGYVLVPASVHPNRAIYTWIRKLRPVPLSDWVREKLISPPPLVSHGSSAGIVPQGQRNSTLASLAGTMRRRGLSQEAIEAALLEDNRRRCDPPLPDSDVRRIAASISRYPPAEALKVEVKPQAHRIPTLAVLRRASEIKPRRVRWLWPERIARRKLTLFAGDPGEGKTCVALDMAAHITVGRKWPDDTWTDPGSVIVMSAEDDADDTHVPRLMAAGADLDRVHFLEASRSVSTDGKEVFRLVTLADLATIEDALASIGDVSLVIVDPVSAYLGDSDSYKNAAVRALLAPLRELAAEHDIAVVLITHLSKSGVSAIYRAIDSVAFVAAARGGWLFGRDKATPDRHLMLPLKNNLARDCGGLAYELAGTSMILSDGPADVVQVRWEQGAVNVRADDLLTPETVVEVGDKAEAIAWLRETLAAGSRPADEMLREARKVGLTEITLRRAKMYLGVKSSKNGFGGAWSWSLQTPEPDHDDHEDDHEDDHQ